MWSPALTLGTPPCQPRGHPADRHRSRLTASSYRLLAAGIGSYDSKALMDETGRYTAVFDPLDGSSNVDAGIPTGITAPSMTFHDLP